MKTQVAVAALMCCLLIVSLAVPVFAYQYKITVQTDSPVYAANQTAKVNGQVSPAPGPDTAVLIRVAGPGGSLLLVDQAPVNGTTGRFSDAFETGGANWTDGTYTVNATWGPYGQVFFKTTSFQWSATGVFTTSATSTSSSSSSSSSASSSTTHTSQASTSSSSSGGGGGIPEFPYSVFAAPLLAAAVVTAYLLARRRAAPVGLPRPT